MVRAVYTAEGDVHTLELTGHACFAEYGKDIVCAGVSAIVQSLMAWAENHPDTVENITEENMATEYGEVTISCIGGEDVAAVFNMAALGIEGIARSYPKHVQINYCLSQSNKQ